VSLPELAPVHLGGTTIAHRKSHVAARAATPPAAAPGPVPALPAHSPAAAPSPQQAIVPPLGAPPATRDEPSPEPATLVRRARECANRGELEEARAWCERAVAADKLDAHSHYLLASVLQELNLTDAAAHALRRTLYLEPRHVLAHYALGHLARREGREHDCARHLRNALRAIGEWPPQVAAREFEGMDVMRLAEVIRASMKEAATA
jgi:chemotaxis protein methyltransferase CheR